MSRQKYSCPFLSLVLALSFEPWRPELSQPLTSAYAKINGSEPEFTNWAFTVRDRQPFIETLDYLVSAGPCKPVQVTALPTRQELMPCESFPTPTEPSDHLLIGAEYEF